MRSPIRFWIAWTAGAIAGMPIAACGDAVGDVVVRRDHDAGGAMSLKKDAAAPASDSGNMGCRTSRDCSGGMEFCHPVRHTCAECLSSTDCEDSRVCTADGICARPCTTSDDCDSEQDGICDPAVHLCTGCRSDADCSRGENPRCVAGRCVSD